MTNPRVINPSSNSLARTRTCIATRQRCSESNLLRVVASAEEDGITAIVPDPRRRMPGRGAWITPTSAAWETAHKRRAFGRALKVSTPVDATPVKRYIDRLEGGDVPQSRNQEKRKT
ncbi:YlxR family protein [Corynebacterium lactis]|uniref:DNA-binding protein n=1 Tax=Corynebacterium lactis RW2-5 TaxID=1408189 RepID=A0A0K2GZL9_9CORY|nr:YlxR family protein [Corynebacterium lactis]ALA67230.1 DNA-binding protein [Corynebacterium lactis RW2-5]